MEVLIGLTIVALVLIVSLVAPVAAWIRATRTGAELRDVRTRLAVLEEQVRQLAATWSSRAAAGEAARAKASVDTPLASATAPPDNAPPAVVPVQVPEAAPPVEALASAVAEEREDFPSMAAEPLPMAETLVLEVPAAPESPARPAGFRATSESWLEAAIGERLLLYVGSVAVVLGIGFFLKYAFDRNWITEWMRVAIGALAGGALTALGLRLVRSGYRGYGQILTGAGLTALYLSVYAAFSFYDLIGRGPAFILLVAITVATAWLSDRQRSQPMAVMAVGGGFLAPFLVGGDTDAQVTLFSYVALLVAGTMYLARRRDWPLLNIVSYLLTLITIDGWASVYYTQSKYLRTTLFLTLFCGMFLVILQYTRRSRAPLAGLAAIVVGSAPVFYHVAAVVLLFNHGVALLVYLIAFSLAGVAWAMREGRPGLRLLLLAVVLLPLFAWLGNHHARTWILPGLVCLGAVFLLHLLAQLDRLVRHDARLTAPDLALTHVNGLGAFVGIYSLLERSALGWIPYAGLGLAAVHTLIARQTRSRDFTAALHALAVAFTLIAASVAVQFDGAWVTAAWAIEGAAVIWIGAIVRRAWFRAGGAALLAIAIWRWLVLTVPHEPAVVRLVLNERFLLGAWIVALLYLVAWIHHRAAPDLQARPSALAAALIAASALTVVLLTVESSAYWRQAGELSPDATFARGLTLSVIWAAYAALLIVIGIRRRYPPIRYFAMGLFALTIGKVFLVDLSDLEGIYRVLGLIVVGAILLLVSFLYQRTTTAASSQPASSAPTTPEA